MKEYIVISNLRHDGQVYKPGKKITLDEKKYGNKLEEDGVIEDANQQPEEEAVPLKPRNKKGDVDAENKVPEGELKDRNETEEKDEETEPKDNDANDDKLETLNRDALLEIVKSEEIEVDAEATKKVLVKAIRAARAEAEEKDEETL